MVFETSYTVTEADIIAGKVVNEATATGTIPDSEDPVPDEPGIKEDPTEDPKAHLTINKVTTSTPVNGETYALGETITYSITATNDGNLTITNITVTDDLTGEAWPVASLAPGASIDFTTAYTVTEADILAGQVVNEATATGTSLDPDTRLEVTPGVDPEPTDEKNGHITISKVTTSTSGRELGYVAGETITYRITVTNDGNLTITNITVEDNLTGGRWTINSLAPGAAQSFETT